MAVTAVNEAAPATVVLYSKVMEKASTEFEKIQPLRVKVEKIQGKIQEWEELYRQWAQPTGEAKPDKSRFFTELDTYIDLRTARDELERIWKVYTEAIEASSPPQIDEEWMTQMERMGIDVKPVRERYTALFNTQLGELRTQEGEIRRLYERAVKELLALRGAGDPLARLVNVESSEGGIGAHLYAALSATVSTLSNGTPSFTAAVRERLLKNQEYA